LLCPYEMESLVHFAHEKCIIFVILYVFLTTTKNTTLIKYKKKHRKNKKNIKTCFLNFYKKHKKNIFYIYVLY